jgi:uncharacterized spore protein YtfJ
MSVQDLLKTLIDEIGTLAKTETVVGDALQLGEHTVIPISRVSVGFGGGSGEGEGGDAAKGQGKGTGGGGGGGVKVEPAAFIVVKGGELSILAAPGRKGALGELFEHMPDLVSKITAAQTGKAGKGAKAPAGETKDEPPPPS